MNSLFFATLRLRFVAIALVVAFAATPFAQSQTPWPSWRGPNGNGTAVVGNYPTSWSEEKNVAWKITLPGRGASTPILLGESIYVTLGKEGTNTLLCFSKDGKTQWEKPFGKERHGKNPKASGSNSSPATDGKNVYVYFKSGDLACVTALGETVWELNIQQKYGEDSLWWDLGTSPVLTENAVVIAVMQTGPSFLVALDKSTGKELWKADRWLDVNQEANQAYTTPTIAKLKQGEALITVGADHVTAHAVSDGKLLWKLGGFNPRNEPNFRTIASPLAIDGLAICPYARGKTVTALRTDSELPADKRIAWVMEFGSDVPTPTIGKRWLYLLGDKGMVYCLKPDTGETIWTHQLPKSNRAYSSSPIVANGCLYCVREDGMAFVMSDADEPKVVSENRLDGNFVATPVFANNRIYIRSYESLYCIQ